MRAGLGRGCTLSTVVLAAAMAALLSSATVAGPADPTPPAPPSKPLAGVVFFFIDTLRAANVHCYGYPRNTTPWLDSLATRGTLFENAISQANYSLPSYATVFTGLYPTAHGMLKMSKALPPTAMTLATILGNHGFRTGAFVAGGHLLPQFGLNRGFDTYQAIGNFSSLFHTVPQAVDWLNRGDERPFFLMVHGYDAHSPYSPPLGFAEMYDPGYRGVVHEPGFLRLSVIENIQDLWYDPCEAAALEAINEQQPGLPWRSRLLVPSFRPDVPDLPATPCSPAPSAEVTPPRTGAGGLPYRMPVCAAKLTTADVAHLVAHYDGAVTYSDMWLGIFVKALEARGLLGRTLIFVAGDHGEALGEHGHFGHSRGLSEPLVHVPLVVSGPGVASGRRVRDTVGLVDLAPTVLELCSVTPFHGHQGQSLQPYLRDGVPPPYDPDRAAFGLSIDEMAIRTARFHLIRRLRQDWFAGEDWQLYDLMQDPWEHHDVWSELRTVGEPLRSRLLDWHEKTSAAQQTPAESQLDSAKKRIFRFFGYW